MVSSSSSALPPAGTQQLDIAPLPLIRCPRCNIGVTKWSISGTEKNPGRHFYKCERHETRECSFWKWEDKYIEYFVARWGHVFGNNRHGNDEHKALLIQDQADLKTIIWLLMAMFAALLFLVAAKY